MIKVEATLVGTVKRGALLRNKDGKNYLSYVLNVNVPAGEGSHKAMEVILLTSGRGMTNWPSICLPRR